MFPPRGKGYLRYVVSYNQRTTHCAKGFYFRLKTVANYGNTKGLQESMEGHRGCKTMGFSANVYLLPSIENPGR